MTPQHIEKFANAFVPQAVTSQLVAGAVLRAVDNYGQQHGGLWVGGKVTVTQEGLSFVPNAMNVAMHKGLQPTHIPLRDVLRVQRQFGWLTGIVVVAHAQGEFRFRCFGAKQVAEKMATLIPAH